MTPDSLRLLTGFLHRLFLLTAMFAVLWVKGYLWWIFGVALGLYLASAVMMPVVLELVQNAERARVPETDEIDEDDLPPLPPTKPFRARSDEGT
jgi:hypothetical protein